MYSIENKKLDAAWIFHGWGLANKNEIELAKELGYTDIVYGIANGTNLDRHNLRYEIYKPYGSKTKWDSKISTSFGLKLDTHLMIFVHRKWSFLKDSYNILEYAARLMPNSILLNVEGPGINNDNLAGRDYELWIERLRLGLEGLGIELGIVVIPQITNRKFEAIPLKIRFMLDYIDYTILEGYSFWRKGRTQHWSHNDFMFPGEFQQRLIDSYRDITKNMNEIPHLNMGLANYELSRPKTENKPAVTWEQNIDLCFEKLISNDVKEYAVWSLQHFKGKKTYKESLRNKFQEKNKIWIPEYLRKEY